MGSAEFSFWLPFWIFLNFPFLFLCCILKNIRLNQDLIFQNETSNQDILGRIQVTNLLGYPASLSLKRRPPRIQARRPIESAWIPPARPTSPSLNSRRSCTRTPFWVTLFWHAESCLNLTHFASRRRALGTEICWCANIVDIITLYIIIYIISIHSGFSCHWCRW